MPKSLPVDPAVTRARGQLNAPVIPVHAYARPLAEERARRGDGALREVLRHMLVIREFETMLATFKAQGAYAGIAYNYKGPAHLSVGQEGAAVGQALGLEPADGHDQQGLVGQGGEELRGHQPGKAGRPGAAGHGVGAFGHGPDGSRPGCPADDRAATRA